MNRELTRRLDRQMLLRPHGGSVPLGTAAMSDGRGFLKPMQMGDYWLGFDHTGQGVAFRDNRHVLICGGTRGGKGVSFIVPNLCVWPGSMVVIDPKGENAMVTARRRAGGSVYCEGLGQHVRILDPTGGVGRPDDGFADLKASYNPLTLIDADKAESIDIAARIADALIVSEGAKEPYWDDAGRGLLKFLILHVATSAEIAAKDRNLATVRKLVLAGDSEARKLALMASENGQAPSGHHFLFRAMGRNRACGGLIVNAGAMYESLEASSPRQMSSILQVVATNTDFIDSPGMQRCLASSDFELSELKTALKGSSLYLCLPQRYMETHYRWLRMMVTLVVGEMERVAHMPLNGHPVLVTLDEFPALRRMRVLENAAAQIAGYGVKLTFVVQTLAQLKDIYKDNWETLLANCGVKAFFCNDDHFTRDYASKLIGDREVTRPTCSYSVTIGETSSQTFGGSSTTSGSFTSGMSGGSYSSSSSFGWTRTVNASQTMGQSSSASETRGESVHKRPLRTPDEIGRYYGDPNNPRALVLVSGQQPVELSRTAYYREPWFWTMFDAHRDHPRPYTIKQVAHYRAERKRKAQEAAVAKAAAEEAAPRKREAEEKERAKRWKKATEDRERRLVRWVFALMSTGIGIPLYLALVIMCRNSCGLPSPDEFVDLMSRVWKPLLAGLAINIAWAYPLCLHWF